MHPNITKQRKSNYIQGRLGLVIDGTGKDYEKIKTQKIELEKLGYETAMIFVNTNIETAVARDEKRERTLGARVTPMWQAVQKNIGRFQNLFRQNMFIVDNSDGSDYERAILGTYRKVGAWTRKPLRLDKQRDGSRIRDSRETLPENPCLMMRTTLMRHVG